MGGMGSHIRTSSVVRHEGVPNIQRQTRTLNLWFRSLDVPPISTLRDAIRTSIIALGVSRVDIPVGEGPWRDQRPGLPSNFLQFAGATIWLVEHENNGEENREPYDSCEGRTSCAGDLG